MRLDLRLHGKIEDGRECCADLSVYVSDPSEREKVVMEASQTAIWLMKEPGWPDPPDGSTVTVERVEDLQEQARMRMPIEAMPGSLPAFLKKIGAGELIPFPFPGPPPDSNDGP